MFIQTESTTDPTEMRFLPGRPVLAQGTLELRDRAQAAKSPLAHRLFAIRGVSGVVLGTDFITVTKESGDWQLLKPAILGAIMDHFTSGAPVVVDATAADGGADGLADRAREALRRVIDPELGYNIVDLGLVYDVTAEDGVVHVTMTTTTRGCPATGYLTAGARDSIEAVAGVVSVEVTLTYDPPWTPRMMSPEAKRRFGIQDGDE